MELRILPTGAAADKTIILELGPKGETPVQSWTTDRAGAVRLALDIFLANQGRVDDEILCERVMISAHPHAHLPYRAARKVIRQKYEAYKADMEKQGLEPVSCFRFSRLLRQAKDPISYSL
jgi:hypothetical protein